MAVHFCQTSVGVTNFQTSVSRASRSSFASSRIRSPGLACNRFRNSATVIGSSHRKYGMESGESRSVESITPVLVSMSVPAPPLFGGCCETIISKRPLCRMRRTGCPTRGSDGLGLKTANEIYKLGMCELWLGSYSRRAFDLLQLMVYSSKPDFRRHHVLNWTDLES